MNIFLIGFMGSGKSFWGEQLAQKMNFSFIDSDLEIEDAAGTSIQQIFDQKGEESFRQLEREWLMNFNSNDCVIATGGGMPIGEGNLELMKQKGVVVFLSESFEVCFSRIENSNRPLVSHDKHKLKKLFNDRLFTYAKSNIIIESPKEISDFNKVTTLNKR